MTRTIAWPKTPTYDVRGSNVRKTYTTYLTWSKARYDYECHGCGRSIHKGEMHGGSFYFHYCGECATSIEPSDNHQIVQECESTTQARVICNAMNATRYTN